MKLVRAALAIFAACTTMGAAAPRIEETLIRQARVFDGTGAPARIADVLIRGDRIAAVGRHLKAPRGARVVDARGKTLIPGLHDLHTHIRSSAYGVPDDVGKSYAGYLVNGVTTVDDFSVSGEMIAPVRQITAQDAPGTGPVLAPHLELAVRLGVPGGHGTEYGWGNFFTLQVTTPRAAHVAMKQALAYHPGLIKVFADGWRYGRDRDLRSMDEPTLAAIVEDAHAAGIPVITHTVTLEGAKVAAAAGVDSVGHGVGDALVDDELIALMKKNHTAYIATLVVYEPQQARRFAPGEWAMLTPAQRAYEAGRKDELAKPILPYDSKRWAIMRENIARLEAAGIPIGIGTDAGIEGVYHGPGTLREIWWLTQLGFSPAEALVAATRTSAAILGQAKDHGTIQPGMRADLVLIDGKPDQDIAALWHVARVWVSGFEMPLAKLRTLRDQDAPSPLPRRKMPGMIDSGSRADGRTDLDTLPVESTDAGADHSDLFFVRPDEGSKPSIFMAARLGAAPRPFAQLVLPLTPGAITLADASGYTGVAFQARGAGDFAVVFDSYGLDEDAWFRAPFHADEAVQEIRIPFTALTSPAKEAPLFDPTSLRALSFRLNGDPGGKAWLEIGRVRFY